MHPSFAKLFVHPTSHKPLSFLGNIEEGRWANGFLWGDGEREMFPVMDGIPIFIPPQEQTWPERALKEMLEGRWIENNWNHCGESMPDDKSKLSEFAMRMAEGKGLILDVGSGPGGGFVPRVLHIDREATVLMDDLGYGVLHEWQRILRDKGLPNVSFALFDARKMPLGSNSLDAVSDVGGFGNIEGSGEAIKEVYRVLKPGGTLFSYNDMVVREDFLKLPKDLGQSGTPRTLLASMVSQRLSSGRVLRWSVTPLKGKGNCLPTKETFPVKRHSTG